MAEFIDRQEEMRTLNREYERDGSSFVVVYGADVIIGLNQEKLSK